MGPIEAAQVQRRKELAVRLGKVREGNVINLGNHVAQAQAEAEPHRSSNPVVVEIREVRSEEDRAIIAELKEEVATLRARLNELSKDDESPIFYPSPVKPVVLAVAEHYGIPLRDFFSDRRFQHFARPRHIAMWMAKELTNRSYPAIGRVMGRDHTSILHGIRKIQKQVETDPEFAAEMAALKAKIGGANGH